MYECRHCDYKGPGRYSISVQDTGGCETCGPSYEFVVERQCPQCKWTQFTTKESWEMPIDFVSPDFDSAFGSELEAQ